LIINELKFKNWQSITVFHNKFKEIRPRAPSACVHKNARIGVRRSFFVTSGNAVAMGRNSISGWNQIAQKLTRSLGKLLKLLKKLWR
jgi:hypothetical protein